MGADNLRRHGLDLQMELLSKRLWAFDDADAVQVAGNCAVSAYLFNKRQQQISFIICWGALQH